MKFAHFSRAILLAAGLALAACGGRTNTILPSPTASLIEGTPSALPASTTTPPPPSPTVNPSPSTPPCDPTQSLYCILDGTFPLQRPISPSQNDRVDRTYPYASTAGGTREIHHGVEFPNVAGTPVLAALDGVVYYAGDDSSTKFGPWTNFYGNLVVLEHHTDQGVLYTLYAHLSSVEVITGQSVVTGEKVGEVGATGVAIGSHLHFEVRLAPLDYSSALNPEIWLIPSPGTGVIALRLVDPQGRPQTAPISIQYFPNPDDPFTQAWEIESYPAELLGHAWENAAMGALPVGRYRITLLWEGEWQERWVEISDGMTTRVEFILTP